MFGSAALAAVVVLACATTALAGPHGTQPLREGVLITEVFLDSDAITILGRNFDTSAAPTVALGELGDVSSGCAVLDPETMFCDLADYHLTIGATDMNTGPWWLMRVAGHRTSCAAKAWLEIDSARFRITGMAGCNDLVARFEGSPKDLAMVGVGGTKRMCAEPLMSQEKRVFEILLAARSMAVAADGMLEIGGEAGDLRAARWPVRPWCHEADRDSACVEAHKMKPVMCSDEYLPVCGCDGMTYANACVATAYGVLHYHPGRCDEELPSFAE